MALSRRLDSSITPQKVKKTTFCAGEGKQSAKFRTPKLRLSHPCGVFVAGYRWFLSLAPLIQQYVFRSFGSLLRLPCKLNFIMFVSSVSGRCGSRWVQFTQCVGLQSVAAFVAPRRATGAAAFAPWRGPQFVSFLWPFGVKEEDVCHADR